MDPIEAAAASLEGEGKDSTFHGPPRGTRYMGGGGMGRAPRYDTIRLNPQQLPPGHSFGAETASSLASAATQRTIGGVTVGTAIGAGTGVFMFIKGAGVLASVGAGAVVALGIGYLASKFGG